jgi:hypothetical protein
LLSGVSESSLVGRVRRSRHPTNANRTYTR